MQLRAANALLQKDNLKLAAEQTSLQTQAHDVRCDCCVVIALWLRCGYHTGAVTSLHLLFVLTIAVRMPGLCFALAVCL